MPTRDATQRFSNRVESYARYRPGYPTSVIDLLARTCGLSSDSVVADIGSGTGILAAALLERGWRVWSVEPNRAMREAAERALSRWAGFTSVDGRAEATGLPSGSADLVTAAQAFHWFDRAAARREFVRILRPGGWIALIWNLRHKSGTAFLEGYERMLRRWSEDYEEVDHAAVTDDDIAAFFAPGSFTLHSFPNSQTFDFAGTRGRLESCSYVPAPGDPRHAPMLAELRTLFDACCSAGAVTFEYDTLAYVGRPDPLPPMLCGL